MAFIRGVSVDVIGAGDPVVLLHGIGGHAGSCGPLAGQLAAHGFRTLSWDAPGYGASDDRDFGALDHATEVVAILEELATGRVHLFGTSWGGVIATQIAAARPDLVRTLVLADSTRGSGTSPEKARAMRARVEELSALGAGAFAAARSARLVSPTCPPEVTQSVTEGMGRVRSLGYTAAADHMARTDLTALLPTPVTPTPVLVGADDVVTGVAESRFLAQHIRGARLIVVPEAGHAALQEKPDVMAGHILTFWKGSA
ncbi:alpha/beta fold hydrolase [Nocardioides sp. B-3]|uniref:alpha/beta fold hydrolase n=1 Tax=Nocardioides sp. B-3 TaxID=2895565 RepID=UPI002152BE74|nr:alpha/beta hydrolase [Nocardioides sp. B-3]UUZ60300.1 alpha/beta hydrolase [Nocardioides sp. B-3]